MYQHLDYMALYQKKELTDAEKAEIDKFKAKIKEMALKTNISFITPAADHPGHHRVYSAKHPEGLLIPDPDPNDIFTIWSKDNVARYTNYEMSKLRGFYYRPNDKEGLEELTYDQRIELYTNQGNYAAELMAYVGPTQERNSDMECALDGARIPTHRRPGTEIPGYGKVPFDLREVVEVKGE